MRLISAAFYIISTITLASSDTGTLGPDRIVQDFSGLKNTTYNEVISIEFTKDLPLFIKEDGTLEDDIFFQDGRRKTLNEVDQGRLFCKIDTDPDLSQFPNKRGIIAGEGRVLIQVEERILFNNRLYSVKLDLSREGEFIDDIDCRIPVNQARKLKLKDLFLVFSNHLKFKVFYPEKFLY